MPKNTAHMQSVSRSQEFERSSFIRNLSRWYFSIDLSRIYRRGVTIATFITPEGEAEWQFGRAGTDERMQARTAVVVLENVRRHLIEL